MRILVTGSSGFIGNKIVDTLEKDSTVQIIKTTRNKKKVKDNVIFYDIYNCDFDINLLEYFKFPDVILHCAWDNVKEVNNKNHIDSQLFFHIKFLENLIINGIKKTIILGTCQEYGKVNGKVSENLKVSPITNYGVAKNLLRIHIESIQKDYNFLFQWIRIFYAYDKTGKTGKSIVYYLKKTIDSGENVFNMTEGLQLLDFIEINEVCLIIEKIIKQNKIQGVINCCTGRPQTVLNLVNKCLSDWDQQISLNTGYFVYREYEPEHFYGCTHKLNKIIKTKRII